MTFELLCGQCQGRLATEAAGGIVACPHCGAHLQVPTPTLSDVPLILQMAGSNAEVSDSTINVRSSVADSVAPAQITVHSDLLLEETIPEAIPSESLFPRGSAAKPVAPATVSRFWFLLLASYASAVTLAFLFLLLTLGRLKSHPLESLPDVVPKVQNGEVSLQIAPPDANVAPGHVLKLGESQRYGSLRVTPLRVTLGPLRFEHLLQDPDVARAPSEPVLKLWLRFENVSRNQEFAPLDPLLLYRRFYQGAGKAVQTNQFLCQPDERQPDGDLHYLFELSATSEFRLAGQNLGQVLGPGDFVETFIPSEERIDDLTSDVVWRVQFRKGYHPQSLRGVTTLIDVVFHRRDVSVES